MIQTSSPDPRDEEPLRDGTSLMAFLHIVRKAHAELIGRDQAHQRFRQMHTRGHAKKYIVELMPMLTQERDKRRQRRKVKTGSV